MLFVVILSVIFAFVGRSLGKLRDLMVRNK